MLAAGRPRHASHVLKIAQPARFLLHATLDVRLGPLPTSETASTARPVCRQELLAALSIGDAILLTLGVVSAFAMPCLAAALRFKAAFVEGSSAPHGPEAIKHLLLLRSPRLLLERSPELLVQLTGFAAMLGCHLQEARHFEAIREIAVHQTEPQRATACALVPVGLVSLHLVLAHRDFLLHLQPFLDHGSRFQLGCEALFKERREKRQLGDVNGLFSQELRLWEHFLAHALVDPRSGNARGGA